jgi:predicted peptidase
MAAGIVAVLATWWYLRQPAGALIYGQALAVLGRGTSLARTYRSAHGETLRYRLLLPAYHSGQSVKRYPLVISLHGMGCDGTDNVKQLICIVPTLQTTDFRQQFPCFVLAPQCPPNMTWVDTRSYVGSAVRHAPHPTLAIRLLLELIPRILRAYPIDARRIYVIGYSSGATGTWDLLARRPELFAAAAAICGRCDPSTARVLSHVPLWVFHGATDPMVDCDIARRMVRALRAAGGHPAYTEYSDADHDQTGARALRDPALFPWLFAQHR